MKKIDKNLLSPYLRESNDDDIDEKVKKINDKWDKIQNRLKKEKQKLITRVKDKALEDLKSVKTPEGVRSIKGDVEEVIEKIVDDYTEQSKRTSVMRNKEIASLQKQLKASAIVTGSAIATAYGVNQALSYMQKRKEAEAQLGESKMPKLYEQYLAVLKKAISEGPAGEIASKVVKPLTRAVRPGYVAGGAGGFSPRLKALQDRYAMLARRLKSLNPADPNFEKIKNETLKDIFATKRAMGMR